MRHIIVIWVTILLIINSFLFIAIPNIEGDTQEKFIDSSTEKSVSLIYSFKNRAIKLELPNRATVTEARLNITGMNDSLDVFPAGVRIDVGDDGNNEWEFSQKGFGGLREQDCFADDSETKDIEFFNGGFNNTEKILLPKNATVISTNMTVEGKLYGKNGNASVPPKGLAYGNSRSALFSHNQYSSFRYMCIMPTSKMANIAGGLVDKIRFRTDNVYGSTTGNITVNNLTIYFGHWRSSSSSLQTYYSSNYAYIDDLTMIYRGNHTFTYPGKNGGYLELDVNDTFMYNGKNKLFYELWYTDRVENVANLFNAQLDSMYGPSPYSNGFETVESTSYTATKGNFLRGFALSMNVISKGSYPGNVGLDFGDDSTQEWNFSSELKTKEYNTNLTAHLNSLINSTPATIHDEYGNDIVEISLNVTSETMGTVSLNNLAFKYNYSVCIDKNPVYGNLTNSLNAILPHSGDGNKTITIAIQSDYYGKVKLSDLFIKYFIPQVNVDRCKVIDGYGINKNKCFAGYQPYTLQVEAWSRNSLNNIKDVVVALDPDAPSGPFIKLKWNRTSNTFSKIYDPSNYFNLILASCKSSNDGIDSWLLNFTGKFSWSYPNENLVNCLVNITYDFNKYVTKNVTDSYYVENDLTFAGTLKVIGEYQGSLSEGNWIRSNEILTWTGLKVVYEGTTNIYPPNSAFAVRISDDANRKWYNTSSSGSEFILHSRSQTGTDTSDIHSIDITNITGTGQDISDIDFEIKIDGTPPSPPTDVVCYSKGPGQGSTKYDTDTTVYINFISGAWQDIESGLDGNFIGYNTTEPTLPSTTGDSAVGEEGLATFYVRAKDKVGNWGITDSASIFIDLTSIKFTDPFPGPGRWSKSTQTKVGILITDLGGSGVAGDSIQYRYTNDGLLDTEPWLDYTIVNSREQISILKSINFDSADSPVVQWRAKDVASQDNAIPDSHVSSPQYSVNIDIESPTIDFISSKTWQQTLTPDLKFYINDTGDSGIDVSSFDYAFSIDDGVTYSDWLNVEAQPMGGNYNKTVVNFSAEFGEGTSNWIKCKVSDIAGNEVISEPIQILIDVSPPYYDKVTPASNEWSASLDISASIIFIDNLTDLDMETIEYRLKMDGEEFGEWTKYIGASSGKEISVNLNLEFIEGKYNAIQWRISDITGNLLVTPEFTISIDMTDVSFTDPIPAPDIWQCKNNLFYGITIDDTGGSGVDASTIQFRISNDGIYAYGSWIDYNLGGDSEIIMINQTKYFPEGSNNYIQWRAKDRVGNGYTLSPSYNIKVDCTPVKFSNPLPNPDVILIDREHTVRITLLDLMSGINISCIAYSIKTDKDSDWSDWTNISLKNVEDLTSIEVSTDLNLPASRMNFIIWRASDIAGNNHISEAYNIQIDAPPVAVLNSPTNNNEFLPSQTIFFDGTKSYDPDNQDKLTYTWKSDITGKFGTGNSVSTQLSKGKHKIEFTVSDPYGLSDSAIINVIITELSTKAELREDLISPNSGNTKTKFTFSVHYNDESGDAPDSVIIVIDGTEFNMKLKEGENASDGIYEYKTRLSKGVHTYYYKAETENKIPVPGKDNVPTDPAFPKKTAEITESISGFGGAGSWILIVVIIIIIIVVVLFLLFKKRKKPSLKPKETILSPASQKPQVGAPSSVPHLSQKAIPPMQIPATYPQQVQAQSYQLPPTQPQLPFSPGLGQYTTPMQTPPQSLIAPGQAPIPPPFTSQQPFPTNYPHPLTGQTLQSGQSQPQYLNFPQQQTLYIPGQTPKQLPPKNRTAQT